jgi:polyvinyl alcohol dehydrogenase (cytochrome)
MPLVVVAAAAAAAAVPVAVSDPPPTRAGTASASTASASTASASTAPAATAPDGAALYLSHCAACHDHPADRIPPKVFISITRTAEDVIDTLTSGVMRTQAASLSADEIRAVAVYLTGKQPAPRPAADANPCGKPAAVRLGESDWRSWGRDLANSRFQPHGGLTADQVPRLKLRWTFAYPGRAAFGQPAVIGDLVLAGGTAGRVFALDAHSGCTYWSYDAGALVRTGIVVGELPAANAAQHRSRIVAWFGDDKGTLHAVDAQSGQRLWAEPLDDHPLARLTGTPVLHAGVLYAPVSSLEEVAAADPKYRCCSFRGSLVALDAASGRKLWRSYTVREPAAPLDTGTGHERLGPAGGAIFSAPTLDVAHGLVYVGTGDSYTDVPSDSTDAILALRLASGARAWTHQVLKNDAWILLCNGAPVGNCPSPLGPDFDFSSSPLLLALPGGRQLLVAGAKSGIVYGLDPLAHGKLLWQRGPLAAGTPNGAILWGPATDGVRVYVATSAYDPKAQKGPGALVALDPATGAVLWNTPTPEVPCAWGPSNCAQALLAAVAVIPGVVFAGAMDGHMRAYDARDGRILWDFDTGASFDAVNGVRAHGGAIDYGGQVIADGMLFVNSGSMRQPGNLLLAFAPDGN